MSFCLSVSAMDKLLIICVDFFAQFLLICVCLLFSACKSEFIDLTGTIQPTATAVTSTPRPDYHLPEDEFVSNPTPSATQAPVDSTTSVPPTQESTSAPVTAKPTDIPTTNTPVQTVVPTSTPVPTPTPSVKPTGGVFLPPDYL